MTARIAHFSGTGPQPTRVASIHNATGLTAAGCGARAAQCLLLATAALAVVLLAGASALADCTPAAGNNVTATCTLTTTNQGGGAPGSSASLHGYGTGTETGLTVTVAAGAGNTVTGNSNGIFAADVTVINNASASTTGGVTGILASTGFANVTNSGSIAGGVGVGIVGDTNATVINNASASITGGQYGIRALTGFADVTNFGSITGSTVVGIRAVTSTTVTNNTGASIAGGLYGIYAGAGGSSVFNAGAISGGTAAIRFAGSGNTLTLAQGSVINGNVLGTGSDTLQLGGSGAATFDVSTLGAAAQYQGFGTFNKIGSSTWTLTGTSSYAGAVNVNGGTLSVNGDITSASSVTVNAGATLGGNGSLPATTINGGTIAPGNSIGTLNVAGPFVFNAGSVYQVEANGAGQSDKINVAGAATLSGGVVQVLAAAGNYAPGTSYNILHATSVTGTFSSVTSNLAFLTASLAYTATDVNLTLTRNASVFANVAQTFNQRAVGGGLDASAFGGTLVQAVLPLTAPQARQAFDQLSGEVHASTAGALVDESQYVRSAILGRLRQASYGGDASMASLSMGGPQAFAGDEELSSALGYAKSPIVTKAPVKAPQATSDIVFWSQGFGAWGKFNSDGNAAALKRDLAGFITGFDARFGNWRGGIAAGSTGSRNNTDGRGSANVDTGHIAAYGGVNVGALNLRAGGAYAFHTIDTDRTINFPGFFDRATAHYQGGTGQIFGEAGYGVAFGKLAIEPFAGAAWVRLDTDAFSEKGGAAALNVASNSFEVGYSALGVRAASLVALDNGMVVIPRASAAWQHAFNSVTPDAVLAFAAAPANTFTIAGVLIARDSLLAEAGLDLAINSHATIGVSYTGQIASNVTDHAAKGKFSWKF